MGGQELSDIRSSILRVPAAKIIAEGEFMVGIEPFIDEYGINE